MKTPEQAYQFGTLTLRNRMVIPPMVCFHWSGRDGYVTEKNVNHYEQLAKGGAGLIIAEATAITSRSKLHETGLGIWEDGQIEGWRRIAEVVHANGAKLFVQLLHAGGNGIDMDAESASAYDFRGGIRSDEMSIDRIQDTVQDFVAAALRAKEAGLDGVELHGCHNYLLSQFMNKRINQRTDRYGEQEWLFAREALIAVKQACGPDFPVGIRLGAFEPKLEDGLRHAQQLADVTDFLDVSYGGVCDPEKPEDFPCSAAVYGAMRIKQLLPDMPVFGVDHINSRQDVLNALATGIDLVDIARASLVDYSFVNHVLNDEPAGKCLYCKRCRWSPDPMNDPTAVCAGALLYQRQQQS